MKKLGTSILVGLGASLSICLVIWGIQSLHNFIWFVLIALSAVEIGMFIGDGPSVLANYIYPETTWAKRAHHALRLLLSALFVGSLVWAIGDRVTSLFGWNPSFWEVNLFIGAVTVGVAIVTLIAVKRFWHFCADFYHNQCKAREYAKNLLTWIFAVSCGLGVAVTILYFFIIICAPYYNWVI